MQHAPYIVGLEIQGMFVEEHYFVTFQNYTTNVTVAVSLSASTTPLAAVSRN